MASSVIDALNATESRVKMYRESASLAVRRSGAAGGGGSGGGIIADGGRGGGGAGGSGGAGGGGGDGVYNSAGAHAGNANLQMHAEQLRHFRDTAYAAIRPIAVRAANQPFQVGTKDRKNRGKPGEKKNANNDSRPAYTKRQILKRAPTFIKSESLSDAAIEVIDDHVLLDSFEDPNPVHTEWQLKYFTVTSLLLTGRAYWHLQSQPNGRLGIWLYPSHWVKPDHAAGPFVQFNLEIPGVPSGHFPLIDGKDMCFFLLPDPMDPLGALSPLQAAARGVTIEEHIGRAQVQSYKNGIRPGLILKAGRLPSMPGMPQQGRHTFTAKQRRQLIEAMKMAYQGWERHGDPASVDGLIEDIVPFDRTPYEMDYQASSKSVQDRIMLMFGTNPISAGQVEGANRASAYVADEHLVSNVVNPLLELIGHTATKRIGPRFSSKGKKFYVWVEKAEPHDADLDLKKW